MLSIDFIQIEKFIDEFMRIENKMKRIQRRLEEISIMYAENADLTVIRKLLNDQKDELSQNIDQLHKFLEILEKIKAGYNLCENKCLDYLEEVQVADQSKVQICRIEIPKVLFSLLC